MLKLLALICLIYFVAETSAIRCATVARSNDTYWTPERMASAIPRDMYFPGNVTKGPTAYNCIPYSIDLVRDRNAYTQYPGASIGKVFFRLGTTNYVCSASIGSDRLVWTAGHCVFERTSATVFRWATQWTFVPGYDTNFRPFGDFNAISVCTSDQFEANGWNTNGIAYDYAVAVFRQREFVPFIPFKLANVVTQPAQQTYQSNGYPQGAPFNGALNNRCQSAGCQRAGGLTGPEPVCISCSSTGGSSGGPWLVASGPNIFDIAGVNSWKYTNDNDNMYSPYFNALTQTFFNDAVRMFPH